MHGEGATVAASEDAWGDGVRGLLRGLASAGARQEGRRQEKKPRQLDGQLLGFTQGASDLKPKREQGGWQREYFLGC